MAGNQFFWISRSQVQNSFDLEPLHDQDGAKIFFSQIGPAVPELLRDKQTHIHTDRQKSLLLCSLDIIEEFIAPYLVLILVIIYVLILLWRKKGHLFHEW